MLRRIYFLGVIFLLLELRFMEGRFKTGVYDVLPLLELPVKDHQLCFGADFFTDHHSPKKIFISKKYLVAPIRFVILNISSFLKPIWNSE